MAEKKVVDTARRDYAMKTIKRARITVSSEDPNTVYVDIFGKRLIFKNGKYDSWTKL